MTLTWPDEADKVLRHSPALRDTMPPGSFHSPGKWQLHGDTVPALRALTPRMGRGLRGRDPVLQVKSPQGPPGAFCSQGTCGDTGSRKTSGVRRCVSLTPKLDRLVRAGCSKRWGEGWGQVIWGRERHRLHGTLTVCAARLQQTESRGRQAAPALGALEGLALRQDSDSRRCRSQQDN